MYAIISKGELLALCERPRYVKRNEETGAYVEAAEAEAIGIAVGGEVYNLPGGNIAEDWHLTAARNKLVNLDRLRRNGNGLWLLFERDGAALACALFDKSHLL